MKESTIYSIMAAIMFVHGVYRLFSLGFFLGPIIDNDWAGGMMSLGVSVYFGLELCVMAHNADEKETYYAELNVNPT